MVDDETADCGGTLCLRNVACSEDENSDFFEGCGSAYSGTCTRKSYGINQPPSLPPPPPFPRGQAPSPPPSPCVHDDRKCSSNGNYCYTDGESEAQTCSDGYTASPHPDEPNNEDRYTCYPPHCHCDASKCSSDGDDCWADGTWEAQTCSDGYLPIAINDDGGQYTCCFDFDQPPSLPPPPPFPPGQAPSPPPSPPPSPCVHDDRKCSSDGNDCWVDPASEAQTCSDGYTASPHPDEPHSDWRYTCYPPHCHCDASKCSSDGDCWADGTWEAQTCSDGYLPIAINDWQYTCCLDLNQPPSLPPPPPFPPGQAPPPAPLVCAQIDWENGADAGCDLFFAAGATCESVWSDYCDDDNPAGAEFNTQTLASSGCSQCATTSPSPPPSCTSFPYWTDPANCRVGDCEMYKDQVCDGGACQALAQTLNNDVDGWCDSSSVPIAAIVGGTVGGVAFLSILAGTIHRSRFKQRTVPPPSTPAAQQPQLEASEIPVAQAVVKV